MRYSHRCWHTQRKFYKDIRAGVDILKESLWDIRTCVDILKESLRDIRTGVDIL